MRSCSCTNVSLMRSASASRALASSRSCSTRGARDVCCVVRATYVVCGQLPTLTTHGCSALKCITRQPRQQRPQTRQTQAPTMRLSANLTPPALVSDQDMQARTCPPHTSLAKHACTRQRDENTKAVRVREADTIDVHALVLAVGLFARRDE